MAKESIVLFGEGKTEAIFLNHLKALYGPDFPGKIKIDKGQGKSPKDVAQRLVNKLLRVGNYDRSLLLLDSDVPNNIPAKLLKENQITLVQSEPGVFKTTGEQGLALPPVFKNP